MRPRIERIERNIPGKAYVQLTGENELVLNKHNKTVPYGKFLRVTYLNPDK
jgi:hypothetical protein